MDNINVVTGWPRLILALVTISIQILAVRSAWADKRVGAAYRLNRSIQLTARTSFYRELFLIGAQIAFIVSALYYVTSPAPVISPTAHLASKHRVLQEPWFFLVGQLFITSSTLFTWYYRRRAVDLWPLDESPFPTKTGISLEEQLYARRG